MTDRPTNAKIWERHRFRRSDPIWQLIDAAIDWSSWYYSESHVKQERLDRAWARVVEKEQALRKSLDAAREGGE